MTPLPPDPTGAVPASLRDAIAVALDDGHDTPEDEMDAADDVLDAVRGYIKAHPFDGLAELGVLPIDVEQLQVDEPWFRVQR